MAVAKLPPTAAQELQRLSDASLNYVKEALTFEENGNPAASLLAYEEGLHLLDRALDLPISEDSRSTEAEVKRAKKTRAKMSRTRQQIVFRIREIRTNLEQEEARPSAPEQPPSYEESQRDKIIEKAFDEIASDTNMAAVADVEMGEVSALPSDAEILFTIAGRVQIFYIKVDGSVSAPSYPSTLHLFRFKNSVPNNNEEMPAFLQVGSWVYPLIPGKSPVLKSNEGSYLFPDIDESIEGNAIGLILPPDILPIEKAQFEGLLEKLTASEKEDLSEYDQYLEFSGELSEGLVKGAEFVGRGMVKGAMKSGVLLHYGAEKFKEKVLPNDEAKPVDPKLKASLEAASWVTSKAAKASGFLVSKAGTATVALGRFLAPHVKKHSTLALSHIIEQSEEKSQKQLEVASEIAGGTIEAFSTVYMALENSSKILAKHVADNTVTVVSHKYGDELGTATDNALSAVGNTCLTVYNAGVLGPKGLAKKAAKDTGKVMVGVKDDVILGRKEIVPQNGQPEVPALEDNSKPEVGKITEIAEEDEELLAEAAAAPKRKIT